MASNGRPANLVWVAEADDVSEPDFLKCLLPHFERPRTLLAYTDLAQIDSDGKRVGDSYHAYYDQSDAQALTEGVVLNARVFAERYLAVRNLILNVSSVLARREVFLAALREQMEVVQNYSFAGDWHIYAKICLQDGDIAYVPEPLNIHRRHQNSATHLAKGSAHIDEIKKVHSYIEEAYGSDDVSGDRRAQYIALLRKQFGLS